MDKGSSMNEAITTASAENGTEIGLSHVDNHEKGIGSPQQENIDTVRGNSPDGLSPSTRKGYGLKKWRRIKRDNLVKDGVNSVDSSKVLKRGLTGPVNPPSKPVDLSSIEARQSSEGSVGSVNMANHLRFSPVPDSAVKVGNVFSSRINVENNEDHYSKIERGKNVGGNVILGSLSQQAQQGKNRIDTTKKARGEREESEQEKPSSSLDSDLRSSDFVFSGGAFSVTKPGKESDRLNHGGGYNDDDRKFGDKVQNGHRKENGEREGENEYGLNEHLNQLENDLLVDSIRSLAAVQEALEKEVKNFQAIDRESISLHQGDIEEMCSSDQETVSASSKTDVPILKQRVYHLENELEEAKAILDSKEIKIRELENSKIESELEGIFQRKMEAEIEHLLLIRSLKTPKTLEEPKKKIQGDNNIKRKAYKYGFYFLMQLILLLCILWFFILQFLPESQIVMPT